MRDLFMLLSGILGIVLFGIAIRRAIRFKATPLGNAASLTLAIALVALPLGWFAIVSRESAMLLNIVFNFAGAMLLAVDADRRRSGGVVSGSL